VLGDPDDSQKKRPDAWGPFDKTPASFAIIEAGATALTRAWTTIAAALGGAAAIGAAIAAFWTGQHLEVQITILAGLAAVLAAMMIALAIMVRADLSARATGAAAQYQARAAMTGAFLQATVHPRLWEPGQLDALLTEAMSGFEARVRNTTEWQDITGIRVNATHGPEARLVSKDGRQNGSQQPHWYALTECEVQFPHH